MAAAPATPAPDRLVADLSVGWSGAWGDADRTSPVIALGLRAALSPLWWAGVEGSWLTSSQSQTVGTAAASARSYGVHGFVARDLLPAAVLPDITRAPFQLLAIVDGIDAHVAGQGELRFVYGIYDVPGAPEFNPQGRSFTLMLTYALPATAATPTRQAWAARFHALGAIPFGADYNTALQAITDAVVRTATVPNTAENPRGSTLVALSINEAFGNSPPYPLRQLRPLPDPVHGQRELVVSTVDQSPDASLNAMSGPLPDFLNANAALVQAGFALLPATLLGMQSSAANPPIPWAFPSVTGEPLRHAFAGETCAGCHSSEAPAAAGFTIFHVIPYNGPTAPSTSGWVTIVDLPRRVSFLQNQLICIGATCAPGAEPMMGPAR